MSNLPPYDQRAFDIARAMVEIISPETPSYSVREPAATGTTRPTSRFLPTSHQVHVRRLT